MTTSVPNDPMPIKVMADYCCYPLWWDSQHPVWEKSYRGEFGNINPSLLGLSESLCSDLQTWAYQFDAILVWDDPASSKFATPEAERQFEADGRALAQRVSAELGHCAVIRYWRDPWTIIT